MATVVDVDIGVIPAQHGSHLSTWTLLIVA